ncbi:MAG: BlaR1 family beta-lactam sensor/signal transducer [Defluviitaleaceae bacterium]|nr:BlaR1 family beta-lactam sensor/signal transducer [Defluviitaleaceae bacterium]
MSTFITFFLMATALSSVWILFILIFKRILKNHISARWQYNLGLLFFALLIMPLMPSSFFASLNIGGWLSQWLNTFSSYGAAISGIGTTPGDIDGGVYGAAGFQDFAISVNHNAPGYLLTVIMGIWVMGVIATAFVVLYCNKNLRLIKESVKPVKNEDLLSLFLQCKDEVGIKSDVMLGSSIMAKTPMTMGFLKAQVILPAGKMSLSDARFAMLHELTHCKNKDVQFNTLMCLFQILYWFNPLVHFVFKQMRLDRELACDASVLEILPKESHAGYGVTLLSFVKSLSTPKVPSFAARMSDSKPHIIRRVRHITSYTSESGLMKIKSICLFFVMLLLVFCKIPIISALANNEDELYHFNADNVSYTDLSYFFDGLVGSFVLYDINAGWYIIHNPDMSVTRVSPNSTYKIISALVALDTGVLDAGYTGREWDGTVHIFEAWNQPQTLTSAMHSSTNWYFQDLDAQVGVERLTFYLTQLSYGNRNISGGIADFWIESSLRISPLEQVRVLANIYRGESIFEAKHVSAVKYALRLSEIDGAVLSAKTGTGIVNGSTINGWFTGYVETGSNTFIFATYIQGDNGSGSVAAQITLSILESMGIKRG